MAQGRRCHRPSCSASSLLNWMLRTSFALFVIGLHEFSLATYVQQWFRNKRPEVLTPSSKGGSVFGEAKVWASHINPLGGAWRQIILHAEAGQNFA